MVNSRFAPRAAGGAVLLLCLAVLVASPSLEAGLDRRLLASAREVQASLEARTGLSISFGSLSPSILRGLSLGRLEARDPRGRVILGARKAYARYDLLSLVFPSRGGLIRELRVEDASVFLDPESLATLAKAGGGSSGPAAIPAIVLSGKRVDLSLEGFTASPLEAELSSFHLGGKGNEVSLDLGGSVAASGLPGFGTVKLKLSATGTVERSLERARLRLSLSAVSDLLSLRTQAMELVYGLGILELRKIEDKAPIDAWLRLDTRSRLLEARLEVDGFVPSHSIIPGTGLRAFKPWFDLPYTGSLSLELPLADLARVAYSGRLSGSLPSSLFGEGYRADIAASGTTERMDIELARLQGPPGKAAFRGSFDFHDLAPSGHLDLDLGLLDGRLPILAGLDLVSSGGRYHLLSPSPMIGGVRFADLDLEAHRQGRGYAASLALSVPGGESPGEAPPRLGIQARLDLGAGAKLGAEISLEDCDLAILRPLLSSLSSSGLAAALSGLKVGGDLDLQTDFKGISYSTKALSVALSRDPSVSAMLSFSGSEKTLVLDEGRIKYGANEALAKGSADFSGMRGLGFAVQLSLGGQSYSLEGALAGGSLHGSGSYGLEFSSRSLDGEIFVSAKATDLPLPGLGLPAQASFEADGRYSAPDSWSLALSRMELFLPGEKGQGRKLSLSGLFGPDMGRIPDLRYADAVSELAGTASLAFGKAVSGLTLTAKLAGGEGESYAIQGSWKDGLLDLSLQAQASPLARFWQGPITGNVGGGLEARGRLEDLGLSFDVRLERGRYQGEDLALSLRGGWDKGLIRIKDSALAWGGYSLNGGSGSLDAMSAALSFGGNLTAKIGSSPLKASLALTGYIPDGQAAITGPSQGGLARLSAILGLAKQVDHYRIEGLARNVVYQDHTTPEWPFVLNLLPTTLAFDGGRNELVVDYRQGGHFSLEALPPFPFQGHLEGVIANGQIDADARGLNIDLPFALSFLGSLPLSVDKGRISGDLKVHGPFAHPDMDGSLALKDLFLTVPGWVSTPVGPLNAPVLVAGKHLSLQATTVPAGDATLMVEASADLAGWLPRDLRGKAKTLTSSPLSATAKVLGVSMSGQAFVDLSFGYSGGVASINGGVSVQKAKVIIDPTGFRRKGPRSTPSTFLDVDISLAVGPGVKVYFPSTDIPVVMGYADPASALNISYDQESGDMAIKGAVFLRGGEVFYIQRDFFLKSAKLVFNENEDKFDPLISFQAERRARNMDGSVLISLKTENSSLFNLQPRLSSSPIMTEGQIVSLLGANLLGAEGSSDVSIVKAAIMGSEMIPQLNVAKAFEEKVRESLGLDIFFVQTEVVQRWLYDISGAGQGGEAGSLASYLDDTSIYLGKYIGDNVFVHAAALLQKDPLVPSGPLRLDSEFGVELEAPFGTITWSIKPESPESLFISDQSLSLTWKVQL